MSRRRRTACRSPVSRPRRRRSRRRGRRTVSTLGKISERGDNDDARGYPDPGHEARLIERHAGLAGRDVLEVGCGNGRLTVEYARRAGHVVALEPNREMIREARARARARGIVNATFLARPAQTGIRGGPFDVVLFSWSLC
ncbi:MAG TPA: class I SAM-dependent methyltransferase [Candidatus Limnocylindria bacterium]|nr:class I SAM-dependent methyltransferase [Candidatus Limnocylindria bacterium]